RNILFFPAVSKVASRQNEVILVLEFSPELPTSCIVGATWFRRGQGTGGCMPRFHPSRKSVENQLSDENNFALAA
ncbi:MAG: hypothetical protein ACI9UK_001938, partial [Candidatus Krumholzibacteriia bacterium]